MINIKEILTLYRERRTKLVSESQYRQLWEVDEQTVAIQIKKGRRIMTCTCDNHTRFCGSPAICRHKESVIAYPVIENIMKQLDDLDHDIRVFRMRNKDNKPIKESFDHLLNKIKSIWLLRWVPQLE